MAINENEKQFILGSEKTPYLVGGDESDLTENN